MNASVVVRTVVVSFGVLGAVVAPGVAVGQVETVGQIALHIDRLGTEGSEFDRLYVRPDALEFSVSLTNESPETAAVVDQDAFLGSFRVRVETSRGDSVPVSLEFFEAVYRDPHRPVTSGPREIEPRKAAWWTISLRRQDWVPFDEGPYLVLFNVSPLATVVRTADGRMWPGRTPGNVTSRRAVDIRLPGDRAEEIRAHLVAASTARGRGDREAALQAYVKAAALDPNNGYVRLSLGLTYLGLGRYREAIATYESLIAGTAPPDRLVARDLATAYLGVRDEANAARVLRWSGLPESDVSGTLDTLRRVLR